MKIELPNETIEIGSADAEAKLEQINRIFAQLFDNNEIVQEVTIDGKAFHDDYNVYLLSNLSTISHIKIHTIHGDQLALDIMGELLQYLPRLLRGLESISELFYSEPTQEDWGHFAELMKGMEWVLQSVEVTKAQLERAAASHAEITEISTFLSQFAAHMQTLEEAFGEQDYVTGADVMKYELTALYQRLMDQLAAKVTV